MAKSPDPPDAVPPKKKEKWSPQWLPHAVLASFGLMLLFILIAVIVSGLVLGGTIQVDTKAIGLTQSLVLFSSVFCLAFIGMHLYTSRKARFDGGRYQERLSLHTRAVLVARITLVSCSAALMAVSITVGTNTSLSSASALACLRCDLAACIVICIGMALSTLVVERAPRPFDLHWITPPIPKNQSSSAKALIQDILVDGVSGHPSSDANDNTEGPLNTSEEGSEPEFNSEKHAPDTPTQDGPASPNSNSDRTLAAQQPLSTPQERQALWSKVHEDSGYSSAAVPPLPSPVQAKPSPSSADSQQPLKHPTGPREPIRPPYELMTDSPRVAFTKRSQPSRALSQIRRGLSRRDAKKPAGARDRPGGKKLFDRAVAGLKSSNEKEEVRPVDWSVRVPGSFIE